jgi:hypothetical protein
MKRIAAALMIVGATIGFGQAAEAYPPEAPTATPSDPTPAAGGAFEIVVSDCPEGETVVFSFQGQTAEDTCEGGVARASFAAPTVADTYTGTAQVGDQTLSFSVTVEQVPTSTSLPDTGGGSSAVTVITFAAALVIIGAGMFGVALTRRRRA